MATRQALTVQAGITTAIGTADTLAVGAGVTTTAGNLAVGSAGGTTTLSDAALSVSGKATFAAGILASGAVANDFSGGSGTFLTSTGAVTIGPGAVGISGAATFSGGMAASGANNNDLSGGSGTFKTSTGAVTIGPGTTTVSGATTFTAAGTALTVNNNMTISGVLTYAGLPVAKVKGSDQSVSSSAVLVNETALPLAIGASDTWILTWTLYCTYSSAGKVQIAVTVPTGATLGAMLVLVSANGAAGVLAQSAQTTGSGTGLNPSTGTTGTASVVTVTATVIGDGTHAGNVTLQFAQQVSDATATIIKAGSGMTAVRH
jgi:hypothetical protein